MILRKRRPLSPRHGYGRKIVPGGTKSRAALCVLGLIDAALGHKESAIRQGRRAVELLPVSRDSINGALALGYLAVIYAWTGESSLAIEQLKAVVAFRVRSATGSCDCTLFGIRCEATRALSRSLLPSRPRNGPTRTRFSCHHPSLSGIPRQMTAAEATLPRRSFGQTMRADSWWAQPLVIFLGLALLSFIPPGRRFRGTIIFSGPIFRRFIRRNFLAIRRTAGSDRNRRGGRAGFYFPRRC